MATAIDYVLLSANVYGRANDNPVGGENEVKSRVNTIPAPGWELIASTDAHDQIDGRADTGFLAAAYRRGNEIVISYSGTTAETAADWTLGNLPAGAGISLAPQIVDAAAFYLRIWNQYKSDSDIQFSFAGHSLGGGLASLMAVYFNQPATIFDPAPFRKSADSDFVFQELLRSLVQQPDLANLVVPDDFANYSKSDGSITSIESRTARQDNVTAYSIAGEVLSLLSADQLSELGENLRPVLRIALEYLVTHPDPALYAKVLLALGITSAAAAALYAASPLALAGAVGLLHEVIDLAGSGVGRITGSETVFDLLTPPDPDLNWGWNALNEIPRLPDPIDLHSVTLLAAVMLSEGFYQALRAHPELLPSLMSNPDYVNDPTSLNPNLFDMLVQRQANGGAALDVLAADVQKIDLVNGVTAIKTDPRFVDGVYASAVLTRVVLAGLYEQGRGMGPDEASLAPMRPVLTGDELSILFDLRDLGTQAPRLFDDLSHLIDVQSQWRGADLAAADYADATWLIQKGTSGVVATAVAEPQIVMLGGIGNDTFTGTSNNDLLSGGSGSDTLSGMGGNDKLIAYDGDDFLYGGHGNDGYFLSRVENDPLLTSRVPTYEIWDASGTDTLTISDVTSPFNLSGIDDLNFKVEGNDLWIAIDVDVDLSPIDDGRIIVHNQGVLDDRIETLALINDRGGQIGDAISLASIWSSVLLEGDSNWHRVILSDAVGVHGRLVNGPSGNPQGQSFSQSGDYDLALAFEAAKLSLAAYDQGAVLAQRLETLGWTPVVSPSLDAGGGRAADGMPGNGAGNAYAFAASRELPDGVEQFVISFRGSNSPLADPLDWVGNNGSRFGFSYYYQQLQAVMAEVLEAALDAKAAGKQVQLLITGHSLGGGAAQAAMADLLLDAGKSTWTAAEGQATALDASHRIYNAESLVGHTAEIRSLIADTQAITFGAPSLLIDPRKPASPAWTITTAYQLAGLGGVVAAIASSLIVDSANSLNADPTELQSLRTHIWQFEHEDSSNFRGSDPVSSLGTADPGLVFDLNITEALHDRYEDLTPAPSMHSMDAYLESMARALVGAPLLKSPNELEATSPLPPTAAAGTPENNLIYATPNVAVDGAEGNDILIVGPNAGTFLLNGGAGSDTFVLYEDSGTLQHGSQRAILDGPISEATDHLVFAHVGTLSADVEGDNVTITLTSPTLEEPMTAKIIGWYSSTVPFQVASIDQVLNYGHETWKVVNHSFQELGIPYYLTGTDRSEIVLGSHADDAVVMGHLGNDTIDGREGGDTIFGDRQVTGGLNTDGGIDNISGGDGDDTIYGGGSWDLLNGDDGSDVIYGDDGDDQLDSGADSKQDFLYGNAGGDRLVSRGSGDMLSGGVGNDTYSFEDIATGAWTTVNDNGSGFDLLRVLAPGAIFAETRFERAGNSDLIIHVNGSGGERLRDIYVVDMISPAGRIEALEVDLGTGTNVASGRFDLNKAWTALLTGDTSGAGVFVGTFIGGRYTGDGDDVILGTPQADWLDGRAGNDTILGMEGDDRIWGGIGADRLSTGTGSDTVDAGSENDQITVLIDGTDTVDGGLGTDRLSIDASTFSYLAGAVGRIWWEGTDAAGAPVPGVDYGSPWQSILDYVHNATTNQLNFSADNYSVLRAAFLTFNGVENLDVIGGVAINSNDLIFAKGTGNYDGKGGVDALVADLSAMTSPVTLVTGSGQTYNYLGSSFSNFEGFLVSTGDADDYIDSRGNIINNHLLLAKGSDVARTGAGADFIDGGDGADLLEGGAGDDTLYGGAGPDTFVYALTGNGVDRIQDIASNDLIKIMGASLTGSVTAGTGSVGQGQVQVSSTGGVTTLYVGTDAAIGAEVTIRLTGTYAATAVLALGESITVMTPNVAPVGPTSGELSAGREDVGYELDETLLLTGFSDADGDPLRATNLSVTDGSLRPTSAGWLITTPADTAPTVTLNYSVTDDHGGAIDASRTIRFTPVNDAPVVANAPDSRAATVGEAFVFTLPAETFSDVDHDALTYAAALGSGAALPAWLSFDAAARTFSGTPSEAASLAIQISATDGFAQVSTAWTLEISPRSNRPPVGPSSGSLPNGTEDLRYIVTEAQLLADFSDPDGDALHLSRGMGVPIGHDLIANQDGTWSIVPAPNFSGSIDLLYWVTDGNGSDVASRRTIHFDPVNDHPVVSGVLSDAFATVGRSFSYVAPIDTFTDVDSPSLTYTAALTDGSPLPSWLRFDPSTLTLGGTPTPDSIGQLTVGLIGSDGVAQATARLLLIVSDAANQAPQGIASHSFPPTVDHLIVTEAQLLEGYSDPDGDVLQVVNLRTSGGALTATGNGTWLLEAARHFDDQVTLTYAVSDNRGGDLPANNTLHLSAPNAVPVDSEIGQMPDGIEDTPYRLEAADLLVGFTDADGDLLLVDSLTTSQGVLAPVGGGWELRTPLNYVGNSTLTYQVGDGYGGNITATRTVYFIPVDDPATVSSADVHVLETNSPIRASGQLTISDLDSPIHSRFQAQDATAGNYGVFQIDPQGQWRFTARMSYDHLNPGQALSDLFVVTTNDGLRSTVKITIDGTEEGSLVRLGAAPERQTGTGGQWSQAWTQDGFNISHKADHTDVSGVWSPVKLSSVGNANLAGGDIYAGDLGVSGQSAATSSIKQELDGKEAIRVTLAEPAISVTVKLSNFFLNDDGTGYAEAGRLRLLNASGDVVGEATLAADSAIGIKAVTVNSLIAFQAVELVAGGYGSQGFVYGAYDDHGATQAAFADSTGRLHGSDFLLDELEFQFPAPMAPGVASIIAGELF